MTPTFCSKKSLESFRQTLNNHAERLLQNVSVLTVLIGNLRTPTMTGSELQCTAQARLVNFVVMVSLTTPNKVESPRPAIHKLQLIRQV